MPSNSKWVIGAMNRTYMMAMLLSVAALSCSSTASGPSGGGTGGGTGGGGGGGNTFSVADPAGDTFGVDSVQWDFDTLSIARDTSGITVNLVFTANVVSPAVDPQNAVYGVVDFDVDQNPNTGLKPDADFVRPDTGTSGIGSDYELDLVDVNPDSTFSIVDTLFNTVGAVHATFSGKTISVRIPRALLGGDDGFLDAVADVYTINEPTDIVPNSGHLRVGTTGPAPPITAAAATAVRQKGSFHRAWLRHKK